MYKQKNTVDLKKQDYNNQDYNNDDEEYIDL